MHYLAAVLYKRGTTWSEANQRLDERMAPHMEQSSDDEEEELRGLWDWYQVGGRWTGYYSEYDPTHDPRNFTDGVVVEGEEFPDHPELGRAHPPTMRWPTEWVAFEGDLVEARAILNLGLLPHTVLRLDGVAVGTDYDGDEAQVKAALEQHAARDGLALVVDYHR